MEDCIFCKIIKGEVPCYKIYEDDSILAFLDIAPVNPGHTLIIPKKHYIDLLELPEIEAQKLISKIKIIAPAVISGLGAKGFNLNLNNGKVAGQQVAHFHWHIIPRFEGDSRELWHGKSYNEGEAELIVKKIKNLIK